MVEWFDSRRRSPSGFTIVELLTVIVVVGILAATPVVAYNGIQQRARDNVRRSDLATVQKILELYKAQNGGHPSCNGGPYPTGSATVQACDLSNANIVAALGPTFASRLPVDPVNSGQKIYRYAVGVSFTPPCGAVNDMSNNYIVGAIVDDTTRCLRGILGTERCQLRRRHKKLERSWQLVCKGRESESISST